jgi:two-component system response regulator ResD
MTPTAMDGTKPKRASGSHPRQPGDVPVRIMVIEDDPTVSEVVTRYLEREGFEVEAITEGDVALERALLEPPDLMVLDLMLPGIDGLEICRRMRSAAPVPIVMLTARGTEDDRVAGLELGADDYVTKPFSPRELTARVKSVLRRATMDRSPAELSDDVLHAQSLEVSPSSREARRDGTLLALTQLEFDLLTFLMRHPGRVFRRETLLEHVWGYTFGDKSTVTVHVRRLREKIEVDPAHPRLIQTVWGLGYRFQP